MKIGGGSRTRTGDIRLAKPTLYQLSYAPGAAAPTLVVAASASGGAGGAVRQSFVLRSGFVFLGGGGASAPAVCRRVGAPVAARPVHNQTN